MNPVKFPEQNLVYGKPEGMTDDECSPLPVFKGKVGGFPGIVSCWKLSEEELEEIQRTGVIWLNIVSYSHPPVELMAKSPF